MLTPARTATAAAAALTAAAAGAGVWLHLANTGSRWNDGITDWWLMSLTSALGYGGTGAFLGWVRPGLGIGRLLQSLGVLAAVSMVATEYGVVALDHAGLPAAGAALWLGNWIWLASVVPVVSVVPLLLPDGRLASPGWRPALLLGVLSTLVASVTWALAPYRSTTPALADAGLTNPFALSWLALPAVGALTTLLIVLGPLVSASALVLRWRGSRDVTRQQLKWVLLGLAAAVLLFAAGFGLGPTVTALAMLPVPLAILVAVLRYGLWDVDVVISRTLTYALLTGCVVALYVLVVTGAGALLGRTTGTPILATALVAVAVEPLHRRLRVLTNRLVHGQADDPYTALAKVGERMESAREAAEIDELMLPALVAAAVRSLHLQAASVELVDGTRTAFGTPGAPTEEVALAYGGSRVGTLTVTARGGGLGRSDRARLARVARQAGVAAHTLVLANAVRTSREQIVAAREEERRRLYRDLHDGLGPSLAALALNVELARDLAASDPAGAVGLLDKAVPRMKEAVGEIRTVVHGLRPPALDDLGLAGAVRELAAGFAGPGLDVRVEGDDALDGLPAATEVATYRIVAESLANAARHAGATRVLVSLTRAGDEVRVVVTDDGQGLAHDRRPGVGLASMTDRAAEAGGRLGVGAGAGGRGTVVEAVLPAVAL
jgi:signal transduction histidine kinase